MQDEVYKQRDAAWQKEYTKLYTAYEKLQTETLERDYEEFKAPDTNNDDMISRAEVYFHNLLLFLFPNYLSYFHFHNLK